MALVGITGGCGWLHRPAGDPRKDPSYLDGIAWKDQGRYDLAQASFQRATDVNPANRYAHLELGLLYLERLDDPVVALYHLGRYEDLARKQDPNFSPKFIEGRVHSARVNLAIKFAQELGRQHDEAELLELKRRNQDLNSQVQLLTQQLGQARAQLAATSPGIAGSSPPSIPGGSAPNAGTLPDTPVVTGSNRDPRTPPGSEGARQTSGGTATQRTHTVRPRETPASIARQYGLTVDELLAANPGIQPTRMQIGTVLRVPNPR